MSIISCKKNDNKGFNGDGYPDVLLGGNDYSYDVSTGYYDALKGVVLMSGGESRSFEAFPPSKSGFMVQGVVESLICFDGDTSLIVAGLNRARIRLFEHFGK